MDVKEYVEFLRGLKLDGSLYRVKSVEANLYGDLNPGKLLDQLFFKEGRWLGFEEFYDYYVSVNSRLLDEFKRSNYPGMSELEFKKGIRARLYRTQFGFLTEYHAYLLAKYVFGEKNVYRDFNLDRKGVDFCIMRGGERYDIHIFVDTERGWYYRKIKMKYRHTDDLDGVHVNLPYALGQNKINSLLFLPNGFGIYRKEYLEYLKQEIDSGRITDNEITGVDAQGFHYSTH